MNPVRTRSHFNRPLHQIPEALWQFARSVSARRHPQANPGGLHVVGTFPVPVCRNIRIRRGNTYR